MLKNSDRQFVKKKKRIWDIFRWHYKGISDLSQNRLNCGCSWCRMETYFNKLKNKQNRIKAKNELKKQIKNY